MTYDEIVDYIHNIPRFTTKNSMDHTRRFMELLEISENTMQIIHVAGTNGKGSTCAYMNEILCRSGKSVGMFTSPHLEQMTERIRINGVEVTKVQFQNAFEQVMLGVHKLAEEGLPHPTFFEFLFGMAMWLFTKMKMNYVILETGLGGRLDATNVFQNPVVTVITSIGIDHEAYLGSTIEAIAREKAGIIKAQVPLIYDDTYQEKPSIVSHILEERACELHAPCKNISNSAYEILEKNQNYIAFSLEGAYDKTVTWKIKNRGSYQVTNAVLALVALIEILEESDIQIPIWQEALYATYWPGRMEEISDGIYIDGGHNVSAIEKLVTEYTSVDVLMFSAVQDKNYHAMLDIIMEQLHVGTYIVTTIDDKRAVPGSELKDYIEHRTKQPVIEAETIEEAWMLMQKNKSQKGIGLCLGSLYLVGMIKAYLHAKSQNKE